VEFGAKQALTGADLGQEAQFKLNEIVTITDQMKKLVEELAQIAPVQAIASTETTQSVLEVANIAKKTSEQVMAVARSLDKLSTLA
jgi:methyl-accepting chemotaxis protein PixJ